MSNVTAGRDELGEFAPKFAELNDDVLFGEIWSRKDKLSVRDRSIVTVVALVSSGILDSSLKFHLNNAKDCGVTKEEIVEVLTHAAFYVGWPKAWAVCFWLKKFGRKNNEKRTYNFCKSEKTRQFGFAL